MNEPVIEPDVLIDLIAAAVADNNAAWAAEIEATADVPMPPIEYTTQFYDED